MLFQVAQAFTPEEVKQILVVLIVCGFIFIFVMALLKAKPAESAPAQPSAPHPAPAPVVEAPSQPAPEPSAHPLEHSPIESAPAKAREDAERVESDARSVVRNVDSIESELRELRAELARLRSDLESSPNSSKPVKVAVDLLNSISDLISGLEHDKDIALAVSGSARRVLGSALKARSSDALRAEMYKTARSLEKISPSKYGDTVKSIDKKINSLIVIVQRCPIDPSLGISIRARLDSLRVRFVALRSFFRK